MPITTKQLDLINEASTGADCYLLLTVRKDGEGSQIDMHRNLSDQDAVTLLKDAIEQIMNKRYMEVPETQPH